MRSFLFACLVLCVGCFSCVSVKPGFSPKHVLWLDEMKKLDACETYEQFQSAATGLGFYPRADEVKNNTRILTYTRDIYVAKTKKTGTQVLGFWINMYIPRVAFATPHIIYPFYNRDFKAEALKNDFTVSGTDENFTLIRLKDQAKFQVTESFNAQNGITTYTVSF